MRASGRNGLIFRAGAPAPVLPRTRGGERWAWAMLIAVFLVGWAAPAGASIQTALPQLLPLPSPIPPPTPAPLPPPINPGYAAAPSGMLSPILTTPGPVYQLPQPARPSYPAPQLPGPIDAQKIQAYRNELHARQWQLQSEGASPSSAVSRDILRQLNTPDAQ
jgi:hypothetical protein